MPGLGDFGLQGLDGVLGNLDRIVKKVEEDAARKALDEQADRLVADWQNLMPVVTGGARDSVRKRAPATPTFVEVEAGGGDAPYVPIIEWGGVHNPTPRAPGRRALEQQRVVARDQLAESIRASVPELKG